MFTTLQTYKNKINTQSFYRNIFYLSICLHISRGGDLQVKSFVFNFLAWFLIGIVRLGDRPRCFDFILGESSKKS